MIRALRLGGLALLLIAAPCRSAAQVAARAGLQMSYADLTEIDSTHSSSGLGVAGLFWLQGPRWHAEAVVGYTALAPSNAAPSFHAGQWDVRVGYDVIPTLALELGLGGRVISPEHTAQDVTTGRVGVRPEVRFARNTAVWGRGAFLIAPRFNDGGDYGLAVELGFGASIGTPDDRIHFRADYDFQRIDRRVGGTASPIQYGVARIGADVRFTK